MGLAQNLTGESTLEDFLGTMAALPWNTNLARSLQDTILESEEKTFCDTATVSSVILASCTRDILNYSCPGSVECLSWLKNAKGYHPIFVVYIVMCFSLFRVAYYRPGF